MFTLETVESLHAYADRLHRDAELARRQRTGRRETLRTVTRKDRRTS
jgi:hypothetical protein